MTNYRLLDTGLNVLKREDSHDNNAGAFFKMLGSLPQKDVDRIKKLAGNKTIHDAARLTLHTKECRKISHAVFEQWQEQQQTVAESS